MQYDKFLELLDTQFKRHLGVSKPTFEKMVEIAKRLQKQTNKKLGGPSRLCIEDQVIVALTYWRQ